MKFLLFPLSSLEENPNQIRLHLQRESFFSPSLLLLLSCSLGNVFFPPYSNKESGNLTVVAVCLKEKKETGAKIFCNILTALITHPVLHGRACLSLFISLSPWFVHMCVFRSSVCSAELAAPKRFFLPAICQGAAGWFAKRSGTQPDFDLDIDFWPWTITMPPPTPPSPDQWRVPGSFSPCVIPGLQTAAHAELGAAVLRLMGLFPQLWGASGSNTEGTEAGWGSCWAAPHHNVTVSWECGPIWQPFQDTHTHTHTHAHILLRTYTLSGATITSSGLLQERNPTLSHISY